jgi:hypothetical protein
LLAIAGVVNFEQSFFARLMFVASLFGNGGLVFGLPRTSSAHATVAVCVVSGPFPCAIEVGMAVRTRSLSLLLV